MNDRSDSAGWLGAVEHDAPKLVAPFRALDGGRFIALRREVRRLAGAGSAPRLARERFERLVRPVGAAPS